MMEKRTKQHGNGTVSIFQCFCWRDSVHYNTEKSRGDVIFRPVESFVHVFDKDVCCVGDRGLARVDVRCPQLPEVAAQTFEVRTDMTTCMEAAGEMQWTMDFVQGKAAPPRRPRSTVHVKWQVSQPPVQFIHHGTAFAAIRCAWIKQWDLVRRSFTNRPFSLDSLVLQYDIPLQFLDDIVLSVSVLLRYLVAKLFVRL